MIQIVSFIGIRRVSECAKRILSCEKQPLLSDPSLTPPLTLRDAQDDTVSCWFLYLELR